MRPQPPIRQALPQRQRHKTPQPTPTPLRQIRQPRRIGRLTTPRPPPTEPLTTRPLLRVPRNAKLKRLRTPQQERTNCGGGLRTRRSSPKPPVAGISNSANDPLLTLFTVSQQDRMLMPAPC